MSGVERFTDACVASATRRWPPDLAADMAIAWRAELAALQHDASLGPLRCLWRRIAFATSLAVSPAPEQENPVQLPWLDRLRRLGPAVTTVAGAAGMALVASVLPAFIGDLWGNRLEHVPPWFNDYYQLSAVLPAIAIMWWIGVVMARRAQGSIGVGSTLLAVSARIVPMGVAFALIILADTPQGEGVVPPHAADVVVSVGAWTVLTTLVVTAAIHLAKSERRRLAWLAGIAGSLVALDVASIVAGLRLAHHLQIGMVLSPAWFPLAVVDPAWADNSRHFAGPVQMIYGVLADGSPLAQGQYILPGLGDLTRALLVGSVFVIAYAMQAVRALPQTALAQTTGAPVSVARPATTFAVSVTARWIAATVCTTGVGVWAWLITQIPLSFPTETPLFVSDDLIWAALVAIALVTLALVTLVAGRGPVGAPAVLVSALLFAAQCVITASEWHGTGVFVAAVALGLAVVAGGCWLAGALLGPGTTAVTTRRALVAVAVAAALTAPTYIQTLSLTPSAYVVITYLTAALLWLIAITSALASRPSPLPRAAVAPVVLIPLAAVLLFVSGTAASALYWPDPSFFIQAPLAVIALAAARWDRHRSHARTAIRWILLGIGAALGSVVVGRSLAVVGSYVAAPIIRAHGHWHGMDFFQTNSRTVGQILVALGACVVVARWVVPPDEARVADVPVTPDGDSVGVTAVLA